jgi:hypothetical protein
MPAAVNEGSTREKRPNFTFKVLFTMTIKKRAALPTKANGKAHSVMASGFKFGPTEPGTKENGKTIKCAGKASSGITTGTSTKENGLTIKPTGKDFIHTRTERNTKAAGKTICNMATEKKPGNTISSCFYLIKKGQTGPNTMGSTKQAKKMG